MNYNPIVHIYLRKTFTTLILVVFLSVPVPVQAEDECGFGFQNFSLFSLDGETELDPEEKCRPTTWMFDKENDGFSKWIAVSMYPDEEDPNTDGFSSVKIYCEKKKISVYVWVEYADSVGWSGTGQVKFDNGSAKKFSYYLQKDLDGIVLKDPKSFMTNLVKAKKKFAFKIPNVDGYETLVYPKGNILEYRKIFAKAGCKF